MFEKNFLKPNFRILMHLWQKQNDMKYIDRMHYVHAIYNFSFELKVAYQFPD